MRLWAPSPAVIISQTKIICMRTRKSSPKVTLTCSVSNICCCLSPTITSKPYHHHSLRVQQAHQSRLSFSTQDNGEGICSKHRTGCKNIYYGSKRDDKRLYSKRNPWTSTPKKKLFRDAHEIHLPSLNLVSYPKKLPGTFLTFVRTATTPCMTFLTFQLSSKTSHAHSRKSMDHTKRCCYIPWPLNKRRWWWWRWIMFLNATTTS